MPDQLEASLIDQYRRLFGGAAPAVGPEAPPPDFGPVEGLRQPMRPSPLQSPDRLRAALAPPAAPPPQTTPSQALGGPGYNHLSAPMAQKPPAPAPAPPPPAEQPPMVGDTPGSRIPEDLQIGGRAPQMLGEEPGRDLTPEEMAEYNAPAIPPEEFDAEEHTQEAEEKKRAKTIREIDKARQDKIDRGERWKGVAEGLDKLGRGLAGMRGHLSPYDFEKQDTGAIDREIARSQDLITGGERQMLKDAFGFDAPEDMSFTRLHAILPQIAGYIRSKDATGRQEGRSLRQARLTAMNRFETHPVIVAAEKAKQSALLALRGLDKANAADYTTGLNELQASVQAARAAGDTRLSNEDIGRWTTPWGPQGLNSIATRLTTGKLPESQKNDLRKMLQGYITAASETRRLRARLVTNQVAGELEVDPDELEGRLIGPGAEAGGDDSVILVEPDGTEHKVRPDAVDEAMRRAKAAGTSLKRR